MLRVEQSRQLLRTVLIETYFDPFLQAALVDQGTINLEAFHYSRALLALERSGTGKKQIMDRPSLAPARDQGFRRAIVTAYTHRCALCGARILTSDGHSAVDAAHIIPWSVSRNDDPTNGLALCKLCHWSFDEGLVSITQEFVIITSRQLTVNANLPGHIVTLGGRMLIKPMVESYWPALECLRYHHRERFRSR